MISDFNRETIYSCNLKAHVVQGRVQDHKLHCIQMYRIGGDLKPPLAVW